jgi:hypothetical protein
VLLSALSLHAAEPTVTVTLAGIRTVWNDGAKEFDGFTTFNSEKGTTVAVLISVTEGSIVAYDADKAKFTLGGKPAKVRGFFGDISTDHKHLKLEVETSAVITAVELATLKLDGTLSITTATGSTEIKSDPFEVKPGTQVTFTTTKLPDERSLAIEESGKPKCGDDPFQVSFKSNRTFDEFVNIAFTSADGKLLESSRDSGSSWTMMEETTASVSYTLKQKTDKLVMVLTAWTGLESKPLKISLTGDSMHGLEDSKRVLFVIPLVLLTTLLFWKAALINFNQGAKNDD